MQKLNGALLRAVAYNKMSDVISALKAGANIEATDPSNPSHQTPLIVAVENGNVPIAEYLLKQKANVNAKEQYKFEPLMIAAKLGNINLVELLLNHGANVNDKTSTTASALYIAAAGGLDDIVALLLDKKPI